ncbi:hypothetical protein D3C72_1719110 [compost metagenome]
MASSASDRTSMRSSACESLGSLVSRGAMKRSGYQELSAASGANHATPGWLMRLTSSSRISAGDWPRPCTRIAASVALPAGASNTLSGVCMWGLMSGIVFPA